MPESPADASTDAPALDASFLEAQGLAEVLGITFEELTPERVVATMPVTPRHHQPMGYLHGGASVALAETAASIGGALATGGKKAVFGLEINANHIRPKQDGLLRATATPLHLGRKTHVWDVRIEDEAGKLVCISRCTVAVVDG